MYSILQALSFLWDKKKNCEAVKLQSHLPLFSLLCFPILMDLDSHPNPNNEKCSEWTEKEVRNSCPSFSAEHKRVWWWDDAIFSQFDFPSQIRFQCCTGETGEKEKNFLQTACFYFGIISLKKPVEQMNWTEKCIKHNVLRYTFDCWISCLCFFLR